jgi:hypothetical protein
MRSSRYRYVASVALIVVASIMSGCAVTPIRQHPDFASATRKVQTVTILPADVTFERVVFNGDNERLTEREGTIAEKLYQTFETTLKNKQYTVQPSIEQRQKKTGKNVDFELQQVRTAYGEAAKQLYEKAATEEESKKYRVTLGPVVNPIATFTNAEALLYVRFYGFEKSGGQQAKDIVAGALLAVLTGVATVGAPEGAALEVALIDGTTGDVLWANNGNHQRLGFGAERMAENILNQFPEKATAIAKTDSAAKPAEPATPAKTAK